MVGTTNYTSVAQLSQANVGKLREQLGLVVREIIASLVQSGRTSQLLDAEITSLSNGRRMALFRAIQIILYSS